MRAWPIPVWSNPGGSASILPLTMKKLLAFFALACALSPLHPVLAQTQRSLPGALKDWQTWVTWDETQYDGLPTRFDDHRQLMPLWPAPLSVTAGNQSGGFSVSIEAAADAWLTLPGDADHWPQQVTLNGEPAPVLSRDGRPCLHLKRASAPYEIIGQFRWAQMPQSLLIPAHYGLLRLQLNGQPVEQPVLDQAGRLWLQRTSTEPADKDFLSLQVYRLLQDGSPQWLHTRIELSVTGKSREETLGHALPEGWRLSSIDAPIPCAIEDNGRLKAQVRAGKWVLKLAAYRTSPATTVAFAEGTAPLTAQELVGLQNQTGFRLIEISGIPAVDVAQTTFPDDWRQHPVYQWNTAQAFQIEEKLRGMGLMKPPGLSIHRRFWLDEDGRRFTYQDDLQGSGQQTWRLDAAPGHHLGAVKIGGESQLITRNPATSSEGVEIRARELQMQAVGRLDRAPTIAATGWQKDAESLEATLNLPPGWRLFAVFGADWSSGDWLTAWSLYDVFIILIFTLAVWRLWGWGAGLVALLGALATFHEPGAPRLSWILLLAVLAALQRVPHPAARAWLGKLRLTSLILLAASAAPFIIKQIQQALYPQLEPYQFTWQQAGKHTPQAAAAIANEYVDQLSVSRSEAAAAPMGRDSESKKAALSNLKYDTKAKIQTGPAVPQWTWRQTRFGWRGPVSAGENVRLWLIPASLGRLLCLARVGLVLALAWLLLRRRASSPDAPVTATTSPPSGTAPALAAALIALCLLPAVLSAQSPPDNLLEQLRERLLADRADLPQRAEIPHARLTLDGRKLTLDVEIHARETVAVPLPGRLPSWSPLSVSEGRRVLRHEDFLWVLVTPGTHQIQVTGLLPAGAEWQWSFLLKPRQVIVEAPGWTVTGIKPGGAPEDQVFLVEQNRSASSEAAYDRRDFDPVVIVERELELGLVWQARTRVRRLSPPGKAIALAIPLLPGERLLSGGVSAESGRVQVRLGSNATETHWESELDPATEIQLNAEPADHWVERWSLIASPVWNVHTTGIDPVYEENQGSLMPVWRPWPGENVSIAVSRPEAVQGATTTIHRARQLTQLGERQRVTTLALTLQSSLSEDFRLRLPENAEVTRLRHLNRDLPVRLDNGQIVVPLRPGDQELEIAWKTPGQLAARATTDPVALPVSASNITSIVELPSSRWLLWAYGPTRGPAVRFWGLALAATLLGFLLARVPLSPLRGPQWALLLLGFMQLPLLVGGGVTAWFFALAWRGARGSEQTGRWRFNLRQLILLGASGCALIAMLAVVQQGLLGQPEMFVTGNGSSTTHLQWFQDRGGENGQLPQPLILSVSIWVYRALMLAWALWLARSVLRWIPWASRQLGNGGFWRGAPPQASPPPLPGS